MLIFILLALLASVNSQSFNFNIQLLNIPASGIASTSLQLSWTFDSCKNDVKERCPGNTDLSTIPKGLNRMLLRRGEFQNPVTAGDVDLLAGVDPISALSRGLDGAIFTIPTLPTENDFYSIYMEAIDANNNPVIGISPLFAIGPVPNPIALITPVTGSVYFTETFDIPYLIRWQYIGLAPATTPDSFSVDLLNTADEVVAEIYIVFIFLANMS
jgi:hypothetical protein